MLFQPQSLQRPGGGRCPSPFAPGFPRKPIPRACPVGDGVPDVPPPRSMPAPRRGGVPPPPGAGLSPTPRRRTSPVGDGFLDVPPLRPPPAPPRSAGPRPGAGCTRGILCGTRLSPAATRRGRRPRRPFPSSIASPTTFLQSPSRGGAPPPPGVRSPPALWRRTGCGRRGPPAKGEPPARVPPLTPSCASLSMGVFRALRRAARAPPLDPARFFVKKRGKKLLNASLHPTQAPRPWGE